MTQLSERTQVNQLVAAPKLVFSKVKTIHGSAPAGIGHYSYLVENQLANLFADAK